MKAAIKRAIAAAPEAAREAFRAGFMAAATTQRCQCAVCIKHATDVVLFAPYENEPRSWATWTQKNGLEIK